MTTTTASSFIQEAITWCNHLSSYDTKCLIDEYKMSLPVKKEDIVKVYTFEEDMGPQQKEEDTLEKKATDWWYDISDFDTTYLLQKYNVSLPVSKEKIVDLYLLNIYNPIDKTIQINLSDLPSKGKFYPPDTTIHISSPTLGVCNTRNLSDAERIELLENKLEILVNVMSNALSSEDFTTLINSLNSQEEAVFEDRNEF